MDCGAATEKNLKWLREQGWEEKIFRIRRRSAHLPRAGGAAPVTVWGM